MSSVVWRNVNFYNGTTGAHLGGLHQNGSITNANFFHILMDHLLVVETIVTIHFRGTGQRMPMNTNRLAIGESFLFEKDVNQIIGALTNCIRRNQTHRRDMEITSH